ncbi:sulfatase [Phytoactinopolyspora endophytica]|uniref:sulfatase family protein n=1 Tax=Phytoactinopolyspora endophytica TaxID=1642495 RepID=UPI00101C6A06|nr:sulfatase-like hydrolase/transferase [Phytoactinopolyspora endophytica]
MSQGLPNIVLVITDQQRFDTIAALGHSHVQTPHLDRLVREGTAFDRMFVTAPSCAPSRASLFTGLYPHTTGVLRNDDVWHHSWVERLADAGYRCVNVGKMHTYPYEGSVGFHERHVVENKDRGHPTLLPFFLDNWDKALHVRGEVKPDRTTLRDRPDYKERLGAFVWELPEDLHSDVYVGGLARTWLERYPVAEQPFFLQVGFPGPHPPYDAVPRHLERYQGQELPAPVRSERDLDDQPEPLKKLRRAHQDTDHDSIVHLDDPTPEQTHRQRMHYYANITMIDEQLGLILQTLEDQGVLDNTVVLFTSDHGDMLNDHGHSQKWTMYEPSVRVPAIVWGPGRIAEGRVVDGLASLFDFGPTILELAGIDRPDWMAAESLMPALRPDVEADSWPGREYVFSEHAGDAILTGTALMTMVRSDRWKLVEFIDSAEGQLFDLHNDPTEEHSLWTSPEHARVKATLREEIGRWRAHSQLDTANWPKQYR